MFENRFFSRASAVLGVLVLTGGVAQAAILYDDTPFISAGDPTQLGRLSRNGVPQDWSFQEPFPGVINLTSVYHYNAVAVLVPNWLPFLQITIDSNNTNIFASAFDTSYNPDPLAPPNLGLDVNFLGDAGGSGNFFGTSPRFFQVVDATAGNSPTGFGTVIVVLSETTTTGAGLDSPVGLLVEGFSDTDFNEVPEPVSSLLLGVGLLVLAGRYRRRTDA